ncbi:MAG: pyridoxal phosphate-dependent aminotransferase, partial [Actinobacteria bacterium]|nr:pyridoxal phosphate-dependent aminotransferase [Actinomycetota bacterium]
KALERQGRDIVHLEIGEPDFATPANIVAAAKRALDDGYTHYGPSAGLPELREAIAQHISAARGIAVTPDMVVVTPGAKPILFFGIMALCGPGDEVLYPDPGFPIYESVIRFVGATPVPLPLRPERQFRLDVNQLRDKLTPRSKLLVMNSPQNPTGGVLTPADIRAIGELLADRDVYVLSDEVYCRIMYGEVAHASVAAEPGLQEKTILLDGFSKTYAMTGWRMGYGVAHPEIAAAIAQLQTNCTSCTASFIQMAGIEALNGPQHAVTEMVAEFKARRDLIVDGLNAIPGVSCLRPAGAFYVFPQLRGFRKSAKEIAQLLLDEAGVAALSGSAFGSVGEDSLRLSFANSRANIQKALDRMRTALAKLR